MAAGKNKPVNKRRRLIDPIYKKFTAQAFKTLTSSEFYDYFMSMISRGNHEFQFTNKRLNKDVDPAWVDIIEATLPALDEICHNPRIIITQEELITNVVQARRVDSQVVRHLCAHGNLVESVTEDGEVVPSKILNLYKEESWDTYENRFVYTLLTMTHRFVALRYNKLFEELNDEYGANLTMNCKAQTSMETLEMQMHMKLQQIDDYEDTQDRQNDIFRRIIRIYELLCGLMETGFAHEMAKYSVVRPPLVPTNAIKKNPYLRKCHVLWDFLLTYKEVGYTIELVEQNPEINEKFEQDIWDNIMFTYIILKGYLEDTRDRALDYGMKGTSKKFKPRYIKEIVEEMIRNYDLPDVEVRKVLIEELTKEQLLREEQEERRRIVEEQERAKREKKRLEELEKLRLQKEKEKEEKRIALEKEKERIRKQKEKEREAARLKKEKEKKEASDAKKAELFAAEIAKQKEAVADFLKKKEAARRKAEELEKRKEEAAKRKAAAKPGKGRKTNVAETAEIVAEELAEELSAEVEQEIVNIIKETANVSDEMAMEIAEDIAEEIAEELTETLTEELKEEIQEELDEHSTDEMSDEMMEDAIEESLEDVSGDILEDMLEAVQDTLAELSLEKLSEVAEDIEDVEITDELDGIEDIEVLEDLEDRYSSDTEVPAQDASVEAKVPEAAEEQQKQEGLRTRLRQWLTRNLSHGKD